MGARLDDQEPAAGRQDRLWLHVQGGSDASNTDRHATGPAEGGKWVDTGPHVMIFNAGDAVSGYPRQGENPDMSQPHVLWLGTPYGYLMIPAQ